ncbi:MAG TPA: glycoside hydrolase family 130 protein [Fibrobacteria bacterium]|nr:glycoside hydrolase family 130 protein [Fibrobacteria bacterium]
MNQATMRRHAIALQPDCSRVIIRPFVPSSPERVKAVLFRTLALSEEEVALEVAALHAEFDARHLDIEASLLENFERVRPLIFSQREISPARKMLVGAMFSGEYALESAALFNPSIVPHPDQSDAPEGGMRFVMSLRATGEGHISSIEFRAGTIAADGSTSLDPVSRHVTMPEVLPNPRYDKRSFALKFNEMGFDNAYAASIMAPLADEFTLSDLNRSIGTTRHENQPGTNELVRTLECVQWLADSNYELRFAPNLALSERIIFPVSPNESHGIEDARFVRFVEDDGSAMYYATYTAYNGRAILPQFIETRDFLDFRVITLNGGAVQNKGMALFPRRIGGRYAMLSRQDDENLLIMFSDNLHYWNDPVMLMRPAATWESVKVGNCGSPLETESGWLVVTHGVGPMRKYCIGAVLLDLEDPTKIIGRLQEPLLSPEGAEREGYVPNVVYSCGSLLHNGHLVLPYAMSDKASSIASVRLDDLLDALKRR